MADPPRDRRRSDRFGRNLGIALSWSTKCSTSPHIAPNSPRASRRFPWQPPRCQQSASRPRRSRSFVKSEADPPDRDARADRVDSCGKRFDPREAAGSMPGRSRNRVIQASIGEASSTCPLSTSSAISRTLSTQTNGSPVLPATVDSNHGLTSAGGRRCRPKGDMRVEQVYSVTARFLDRFRRPARHRGLARSSQPSRTRTDPR